MSTTAEDLADLLRLARSGGTIPASTIVDLVEALARVRCAEADADERARRAEADARRAREHVRACALWGDQFAACTCDALKAEERKARRSTIVGGKHVALRPWQVGLANMSEPSLARLMRALIEVHGQITGLHGLGGGRRNDWRSSLVVMVLIPDGLLSRFREVAKPFDVETPARINVGRHEYACGGEDGAPCAERCPPWHHGGTEWRDVLEERAAR